MMRCWPSCRPARSTVTRAESGFVVVAELPDVKRKAPKQGIPGLFITGTDTGVGKTVVTAGLAVLLRRRGLRVGVFKPVATGCVRRVRLGLVSEDADFLAYFAESPDELATINPVHYGPPVAPSVAAQRSRRPVDTDAIWRAYRRICDHSDVVLVEGIGGLLVPLADDLLVADLAGQFGLPLVIVAWAGLGTINHTLLTIEAARRRDLEVTAVVLNRYIAKRATLAEETNPETIARHGRVPLPVMIPEDKRTSVADVTLGSDVLAALEHLAWPGAIASLIRRHKG